MKVRIKKVTDGYGTFKYYPQRRVFGVWVYFRWDQNSDYREYFLNEKDCRDYLDMKLIAALQERTRSQSHSTYLTHP